MGKRSRVSTGWNTLICDSTGATFWPVTGWMDAKTVGSLVCNFEVRCLDGDQEVSAAYQTANVENSPDAAQALGSYVNANGMTYGSAFTDVSANTQPKQLVRFGFLVKNTATSNVTWTRVSGTFDVLDMQ